MARWSRPERWREMMDDRGWRWEGEVLELLRWWCRCLWNMLRRTRPVVSFATPMTRLEGLPGCASLLFCCHVCVDGATGCRCTVRWRCDTLSELKKWSSHLFDPVQEEVDRTLLLWTRKFIFPFLVFHTGTLPTSLKL